MASNYVNYPNQLVSKMLSNSVPVCFCGGRGVEVMAGVLAAEVAYYARMTGNVARDFSGGVVEMVEKVAGCVAAATRRYVAATAVANGAMAGKP